MLSSLAKSGVLPCGCIANTALHARQNCTKTGAVVPIGNRARRGCEYGQKALRSFDTLHCPAFPFASKGPSRALQSQQGRGGALATTCGDKVTLKILLANQVAFGEKHGLAGSHGNFGKWAKPVEMKWSEAGWTIEIDGLAPNERIEYKYVILKGDAVEWEGGHNRVLQLPSQAGTYKLLAAWNQVGEEPKFVMAGEVPARQIDQAVLDIPSLRDQTDQKEEGELAKGWQSQESHFMGSMEHSVESQGEWGDTGLEGLLQQDELEISTYEDYADHSLMSFDDYVNRREEGKLAESWQGRDIGFMESHEYSVERRQEWDITGLEGLARELVEGDREAGDWGRKLEVAKSLIVPQEMGKAPSMEALVYTAIYLQWINSGAIPCFEDGSHHSQNNKHADISRKIFRQLEWEMGRKDVTAQALMVMRQIHPRLPALSEQSTQSVPLTRIQDITHRNDIPFELQQEIEHTLQNKLHRNAGPEALVATEALLARVSQNPREYSQDFVEQLRIFTEELKQFLYVDSLVDRLEAVRESFEPSQEGVLDLFLSWKLRLEAVDTSQHSSVAEACLGCLHSLTALRAMLLNGLASGLRNDASDASIAMRQKWRLSEIGLEGYSAVLLSRFINALDEAGGASMLAEEASKTNVFCMNHPLGAAVLGLRQLGLSGWQQAECSAIENELQAWQAAGIVAHEGDKEGVRTWALRQKATLERARRLAEAFSAALPNIYSEPSRKLGRAFRIDDDTVRSLRDAEVQASVAVQLSKLCSVLLEALRLTAESQARQAVTSAAAKKASEEAGRSFKLEAAAADRVAYRGAMATPAAVKDALASKQNGAGNGAARQRRVAKSRRGPKPKLEEVTVEQRGSMAAAYREPARVAAQGEATAKVSTPDRVYVPSAPVEEATKSRGDVEELLAKTENENEAEKRAAASAAVDNAFAPESETWEEEYKALGPELEKWDEGEGEGGYFYRWDNEEVEAYHAELERKKQLAMQGLRKRQKAQQSNARQQLARRLAQRYHRR